MTSGQPIIGLYPVKSEPGHESGAVGWQDLRHVSGRRTIVVGQWSHDTFACVFAVAFHVITAAEIEIARRIWTISVRLHVGRKPTIGLLQLAASDNLSGSARFSDFGSWQSFAWDI